MSIDWKRPEDAGNVRYLDLGIEYMTVYICIYIKIHQAVHLGLEHLKNYHTLLCVLYLNKKVKQNNVFTRPFGIRGNKHLQ